MFEHLPKIGLLKQIGWGGGGDKHFYVNLVILQ